MKGWMYILECADGTYYTGSTNNLEKRIWEHQNLLGANYTKKKHPVKLVYAEEFPRIDNAFYREKQVQNWSHAKKKALIEGKRNALPELAKKDFSAGHLDTTQPYVSIRPGISIHPCGTLDDRLESSMTGYLDTTAKPVTR